MLEYRTENGDESVEIGAVTGLCRRWTDFEIPRRRAGAGKGDGRAITPDVDVYGARIAEEWVRRWMPRLCAANWRQVGADWMEYLPNGVCAGNYVHLRVALDEQCVWGVSEWSSPALADPTPRVTMAVARQSASEWIRRHTGVTQLTIRALNVLTPPLPEAAVVSTDPLGMPRLAYMFFAAATRPEYLILGDQAADHFAIGVDARTGAVFPADSSGPQLSGTTTHTWAEFTIDGDNVDLSYPVVFDNGHAYMWIGYLESMLWPGRLVVKEGMCEGESCGHKLLFNVGQLTAQLDHWTIVLPAAPMTMDGEVYLPVEGVQEVTGWQFRSEPERKLVICSSPPRPTE